MRRAIFILGVAFVAGMLLSAACLGQIKSERAYEPYEPIVLEVTLPDDVELPEGAKVNSVWRIDAPAQHRQVSADTVHIWAGPQSRPYQVIAIVWCTKTVTVDGTEGDLMIGPPREYQASFRVNGEQPGPDPPDPPPRPNPDEPDTPDKSESPFVEEGLRVLIVYELDEMSSYSSSIQSQLYGSQIRTWAAANCVKASNGTPEFRVFDKDIESADHNKWTQAIKRKRDKLPWLIVGNGKVGYEGPLPDSIDATLKLLEGFK